MWDWLDVILPRGSTSTRRCTPWIPATFTAPVPAAALEGMDVGNDDEGGWEEEEEEEGGPWTVACCRKEGRGGGGGATVAPRRTVGFAEAILETE